MGVSARGASYGRVISSETLQAVTGSVVVLSPPAAARSAFVTVGANPVRFRSDGTDPTTSVGHYLAANSNLEVHSDEMNQVKFRSTTSTSDMFVTFYGE